MEWWIWLVIALAAVAVCAVSALGIQARRRGGGVIAGKRPPRGGTDRNGS
ncbi:hypothetical protein [Streptomyces sp. AS58]|nr:hypothetical protein [Streptomyces sp. AS58]